MSIPDRCVAFRYHFIYFNETTSTSFVVSWKTEPLMGYFVEVEPYTDISQLTGECPSNSRQSSPVSKSLPENL